MKLIGTIIYHLGLRSFINEAVELKTKDFQSDSDGGFSRLLFDPVLVRNKCFGERVVEIETRLETSLTKWITKLIVDAK